MSLNWAPQQIDSHGYYPDSARHSGAGFAAVLPTRALPRFTPAELMAAIARLLGATAAEARLIPELTEFEQSPGHARVWHRPKAPPRIGVDVAGVAVVVEGQDRAPGISAAAGTLGLASWPAGAREIGRARAHLRIFEAAPSGGADFDHNHDRAAAVTAVAAAAAALAEPCGIVWEPSAVALPAAELEAAVRALLRGTAPAALWIGTTETGRAEAWGAVVTTRGLDPLLGAEVEVAAPGLGAAAADAVARAVAARILETGVPPAEGAPLLHGRAAFRVFYRGAGEAGSRPAVVLEPLDLPLAAGAA